jgi:hypothetical protein
MKYRKLRIAWSVACGILCLLLIALWVRSYRSCDIFVGKCFAGSTNILINRGSVRFMPLPAKGETVWSVQSLPPQEPFGGVYFSRKVIQLPVLMLVLFPTFMAAITWFPCSTRFSLRSLLIGMTVVTILLGLLLSASNGN